MSERSNLIEAKRVLYLLLLKKPSDKMTCAEIKTGHELSRDDDIQAILAKHVKDPLEQR